ncbi:MAG: rRNA maturation RNase YbeY [Agriterribacter sp.]
MSSVQFFFPYAKIGLQNRKELKGFIEQLFKKEKRPLDSLRYIFCSDEDLLKINAQYLRHHYYTDIITFELGSVKTDGEIYISIDRVKENAQTFGTSFLKELHRVIFHGALHLCGYKDKLKADKEIMRKKEDRYLREYFD